MSHKFERPDDLQARVDLVLSGQAPTPERAAAQQVKDETPFAFFMPEDLDEATELAAHFAATALTAESDGLSAAVDEIYASLGRFKPGLVQYATRLFLTHYPEARERLVIRSLEELQPGLVQPSRHRAQVER